MFILQLIAEQWQRIDYSLKTKAIAPPNPDRFYEHLYEYFVTAPTCCLNTNADLHCLRLS